MISLQPGSPWSSVPDAEGVFEALFHNSPFPLVVTSLVRDMVLAFGDIEFGLTRILDGIERLIAEQP